MKHRNALKAGIFMVIALGLTIAIILGIAGTDRFIQPWQKWNVSFDLTDDLSGLRVGDEVRIGGFAVGTVRDIDILSGENPAIIVRFEMPQKYTLRENARVTVQSTLTGTSWLNIDYLGTGATHPADQALVGRPGTFTVLANSMADLGPQLTQATREIRTITLPKLNTNLDQIEKTVAEFKQAGTDASALMTTLREKINPIVEKYNVIADRAAEAITHMRDLVQESRTDIRKTMANLEEATGAMKDKLPGVLDELNSTLTNVNQAVTSISGSLDDVKASITNTRDLTAAARSVVISNRSKLDGMIESLKTTGDNLKAASAEIRRSPWRLLYKPNPGEMGNLNLFDSARQFAEGANDLNDAASALRDALKDPNADEAQIQKLMKQVEESFTKFNHVEQALWKEVQE